MSVTSITFKVLKNILMELRANVIPKFAAEIEKKGKKEIVDLLKYSLAYVAWLTFTGTTTCQQTTFLL